MTAEGDLEPGTEGGFWFDVAALPKIQYGTHVCIFFILIIVGCSLLACHILYRMPERYMRKRLDPIRRSLRLPRKASLYNKLLTIWITF